MSFFAIDLAVPIGARSMRVGLESQARAIAIVGASGVGKTTLLRAIAGLVVAPGTLVIGGRALHGLAPEARSIGWAPQDARLFPHLSVRENVAFPRAASAAIERAAVLTGIEPLLSRAPATLSGGERQRVAIARALACSPRVLLLDEPLAALDRTARTELAIRLRDHARAHDLGLVLVAHDESDVAALADDVFLMEEAGVRRAR